MNRLPERWEKFLKIAGSRRKGKETTAVLLAEYRRLGCLARRPRELLGINHADFAAFYAELAAASLSDDGRILSPVEAAPDSAWMVRSDFCFLNARAVSPDPARAGTFIDALHLLAMPRVDSFHLAPFFTCVFGNVYAIDSLSRINPELVDAEYAAAGLGADDQLLLLIDAVHALGRTIGFDLEPHTSQFSEVVLDHPDQFRWIALAANRKGLDGGLEQDEMLAESVQEQIHARVREVVGKAFAGHGITRLAAEPDAARARQAQGEATGALIKAGLWTMPSHTWGGVGLPEFRHYDKSGNYPVFDYLDRDGEDQGGHAFGMLTPYKFATDLAANTVPTLERPSRPWEPGIDFFAGIFPGLAKRFPFDFVRLDYVDHVFDSVVEGTRDIPLADRPTPYVLERVIRAAREVQPGLGVMAERMGYDLEDYASVGFDLILGADVIQLPDVDFLKDMLGFTNRIAELNASRAVPVSIQYAVDTHDTGHPGIDTNPVRFGARGMLLRLFLARFGNCGGGRRPKYEVIGNQDLSHGLYEANNRPVSLAWADDAGFFAAYQALENVHARFRVALERSYLRESHLEEHHAVWYLDRADGFRMRLVCVCNPDMGEDGETVESLRIFPFAQYAFDCARVDQVLLESGTLDYTPLEPDGHFLVDRLEPGEVRLFWIREDGSELPEEAR